MSSYEAVDLSKRRRSGLPNDEQLFIFRQHLPVSIGQSNVDGIGSQRTSENHQHHRLLHLRRREEMPPRGGLGGGVLRQRRSHRIPTDDALLPLPETLHARIEGDADSVGEQGKGRIRDSGDGVLFLYEELDASDGGGEARRERDEATGADDDVGVEFAQDFEIFENRAREDQGEDEEVVKRDEGAGEWGGGGGGEGESGGGDGFSLHASGGPDEKELGIRVQGLELFCYGDGGVNVAACATGGENYSEIVGGSGSGGGGSGDSVRERSQVGGGGEVGLGGSCGGFER